jgi:hypothetical protein
MTPTTSPSTSHDARQTPQTCWEPSADDDFPDQLTATMREDWPRLIRRAQQAPTRLADVRHALDNHTGALTDDLLDRMYYTNNAAPKIRTRDMEGVDALMTTAVRYNRANGTGRLWAGITSDSDGPGAGKTETVLAVAQSRTAAVWQRDGRIDANGNERWPYGYVQLTSNTSTNGLMHSVYRFFGFPYSRSANADDLAGNLAYLLREVGNQAIIFDDAHLPTNISKRTAELTNFIRALLQLPTTLIFIGNNLKGSFLLDGAADTERMAAAQLRIRHRGHKFHSYRPNARDRASFTKVVRVLEQQLVIDGSDLTGTLTDPDVIDYLITGWQGRLGTAVGHVRFAVNDAIGRSQPLNLDWLKRTHAAYEAHL